MIDKDIIEKELKKITNKKIKVKVNPNKRKGVYSWVRYIEFNGSIDFDLTELDGTLAHEIVHIEERHFVKLCCYMAFLFILIATFMIIVLDHIKIHLNVFCSLAFISIVIFISEIILFITLSRHFERVADKKAAEKVGKVPMIRALEKISTWKESDRLDLTHDKPRKRIENLKKLDLPDFIKLK